MELECRFWATVEQRYDHGRGNGLAEDGRHGGAFDSPAENGDEEDVQDDVGEGAYDQAVQRGLAVPHGAEDAGTHVVDQLADGSKKEDVQIGDREVHDFLRSADGLHGPSAHHESENHDDGATENRHAHGGLDGPVDGLFLLGAELLADDDACPVGHAYEESDEQVDEGAGSSSHRGERLGSDELADDDGVGGVVQLLEEGTEQDGEIEIQDRTRYRAFGNRHRGVNLVRASMQGHAGHVQSTLLESVPIFSMVMATSSPWSSLLMPLGVPVEMMSPGSSVMTWLI